MDDADVVDVANYADISHPSFDERIVDNKNNLNAMCCVDGIIHTDCLDSADVETVRFLKLIKPMRVVRNEMLLNVLCYVSTMVLFRAPAEKMARVA